MISLFVMIHNDRTFKDGGDHFLMGLILLWESESLPRESLSHGSHFLTEDLLSGVFNRKLGETISYFIVISIEKKGDIFFVGMT